jgi:hypothetical protein
MSSRSEPIDQRLDHRLVAGCLDPLQLASNRPRLAPRRGVVGDEDVLPARFGDEAPLLARLPDQLAQVIFLGDVSLARSSPSPSGSSPHAARTFAQPASGRGQPPSSDRR